MMGDSANLADALTDAEKAATVDLAVWVQSEEAIEIPRHELERLAERHTCDVHQWITRLTLYEVIKRKRETTRKPRRDPWRSIIRDLPPSKKPPVYDVIVTESWHSFVPTDRLIEFHRVFINGGKSANGRADTSKNRGKIPSSRDPLTQYLLNRQFNERASGKDIEVINREFFAAYKRKLGKSDDERKLAFERIKANARRCTRKAQGRA
jgi:hypothetical protein